MSDLKGSKVVPVLAAAGITVYSFTGNTSGQTEFKAQLPGQYSISVYEATEADYIAFGIKDGTGRNVLTGDGADTLLKTLVGFTS